MVFPLVKRKETKRLRLLSSSLVSLSLSLSVSLFFSISPSLSVSLSSLLSLYLSASPLSPFVFLSLSLQSRTYLSRSRDCVPETAPKREPELRKKHRRVLIQRELHKRRISKKKSVKENTNMCISSLPNKGISSVNEEQSFEMRELSDGVV